MKREKGILFFSWKKNRDEKKEGHLNDDATVIFTNKMDDVVRSRNFIACTAVHSEEA